MGVLTSEVGYTAAMHRKEDREVHKDMWWHWAKKKKKYYIILKSFSAEKKESCQFKKNVNPLKTNFVCFI
jgi:hypothetical protein